MYKEIPFRYEDLPLQIILKHFLWQNPHESFWKLTFDLVYYLMMWDSLLALFLRKCLELHSKEFKIKFNEDS